MKKWALDKTPGPTLGQPLCDAPSKVTALLTALCDAPSRVKPRLSAHYQHSAQPACLPACLPSKVQPRGSKEKQAQVGRCATRTLLEFGLIYLPQPTYLDLPTMTYLL